MSVNWPSTIPQITDGVTRFAEADLNPIIQSLTDRTDFCTMRRRHRQRPAAISQWTSDLRPTVRRGC